MRELSSAMNEQVASSLIDVELDRLRKLSYSEIVKLIGESETKCVVGTDGKSYQLEIEAVCDSGKGEDVRVIIAADDGSWRAFYPLTNDFIMRPDGSIIGESLAGY